jgi:hypothetical protein
MIRNTLSFVLVALALACGGVDNGDLFDDASAELDGGAALGSVEQAFTTQQATSGASRRWTGVIRSSGGGLVKDTCQSLQSTSVVCYVPNDKVFTVSRGNNNCSEPAYLNFSARVDEYIAAAQTELAGSGWTVSAIGGIGELDLVCDTYPVGAGTDVAAYVDVFEAGDTHATLTETLPGTFITTNLWAAYVDGEAIMSMANTTLNRVKAMRHAVGHAFVKPFGVGRSSNSGFVSNLNITGSGDLATGIFSAGEKCRVRNFVAGGSSLGLSQSANCAND